MNHAGDGGNVVFVYMGGDQRVPRDVTHVRIHKSVKIITAGAFQYCRNLVSIEMHDGVEIIEEGAFLGCSLIGIKLPGVRFIEQAAFFHCTALTDVEFGDKLESIGSSSFRSTALRNIKIPTIRVIGILAFADCTELTGLELSEDLERIERSALSECHILRHIAIPLKHTLLDECAFEACDALSQVDLVGGIHQTISSLFLDNWRNEINDEIGRINQVLPNTLDNDKTEAIQQWLERVIERMDHYKNEHYALLKNNMTQLELALWDANLPNVDAAASRDEARVTCGADIIIPHVLSFLNDTDEFPLRDYNLVL